MNTNPDIDTQSILVVGDLMVDRYQIGEVCRISPEAPVPVFRQKYERQILGGAGNVVANLCAANQRVWVASVIGRDDAGDSLLTLLSQQNTNCECVIRSESRPTTVKTRFVGQNKQQLFRADTESTDALGQVEIQELLERIHAVMDEVDIVILSDYGKGVLTKALCKSVIASAKEKGKRVLVDVKGADAEKYRSAYIVKPNLVELAILAKKQVGSTDEIHAASQELCQKYDYSYTLTTLGEKGMCLSDAGKTWIELPACTRDVFDVTGAGDTVIAYLAATLANGLEIEQAMALANTAAGIQVSKSGTAAVYLQDVLRAAVQGNDAQYNCKQISWQEAALLHKRNPDKKLVFTNGCFDILHVGHVEYLRRAAELGDILIIGVNSDESVRRLKGATRPINKAHDRVLILSALEFVDHIIVFEEDTPEKLIHQIVPDVLVKGGDYRINEIVGSDFVRESGGVVTTIPLVKGKSTTGIIEQMQKI